jgi:hypothetical protein
VITSNYIRDYYDTGPGGIKLLPLASNNMMFSVADFCPLDLIMYPSAILTAIIHRYSGQVCKKVSDLADV